MILFLETMLEVVIGVLVMEVDKVTDMKIPIEDLTGVILTISDTYND